MKLHLPSSLRKALLLGFGALTAFSTSAQAEIMHNSATLLTYTDFASNMGRYSIYEQNALLKHMNKDGVFITFTQGEKPYKLVHGIISFESAVDGGPFTAIGYNVTATVQHNGVPNPVFTGRFLGSGNSVQYAGIEYRSCTDNTFLLTPQTDYKITRLSKVITDITPSALFDTEAFLSNGGNLKGMLQYHMGGGYQQRADETGKTTWLREAYVYVTAGIVEITGFSRETAAGTRDGRDIVDDSYTISMTGVVGGDQWGPGSAGTPTHPLPYVTQGGDSGSPVWVWNETSKAYELISCHQARGGNNSYSRGASDWTMDTLESFCVNVDMDSEAANHTVHISAVDQRDDKTISAIANGSQDVSTTPWHGKVVLSNGEKIDFIGVQSGVNTWNNLNPLKDGQISDGNGGTRKVNWYAYGNEYLNSTYNEGGQLQYADLFMTENLVFKATGNSNKVILDATVDLGIGYAQFSAKDGETEVSYTIQGKDGNNSLQFNHAGYIVDKGVDVHIQLVNDEPDYFREWRKVGEGNLYLEGQGDNHIFLNVGGKGTTFLKEQGGYAAYNVLINNGATVNLGGNKGQVERDVTFGYGGGVLDFAGDVEMDWYLDAPADNDGFTINALTQDAVIANTSGNTTLTYRQGGDTKFLGSFRDSENSSLKVVYDAAGTWTLNSIHTHLQNSSSGLEVKSGKVVLAGTNTVHAQGSLNGFNQQRYSNADDWHYADASMNVTVGNGATFELGSHARLTGDVTVNGSGIFQMDEGVRHQKEYIEGWYELEDTYKIAAFYGLHGDVELKDADSKMVVQFSAGTDANTTVTGNIIGEGSMTVDTAGGSLTLTGTNTFTGAKSVTNGILVLEGTKAAGTTTENKWKLGSNAQLLVNGTAAKDALPLVAQDSSGVLVLTGNESGSAINMDGYTKLIIGAEAGKDIQFGAENSEYALAAVDGKWNLGGGGGNLVVNYQLDNKATLVLGNGFTTGSVTLTNTKNQIGAIDFAGKVTLAYTDVKALGGSTINLGYTNRIMGSEGTVDLINKEANGVMLLDNMANQNINLSGHTGLHLGSSGDVVYKGNITLDKNADTYYFGGITGTLVLDNALTDQNDGWTNLVLDGQTYSGGVLELAQALQIKGSVEVGGHSPYIVGPWPSCDATLRLCVDNSFDGQWVQLHEGGVLDINGTDQTLSYIESFVGSKIIDSKGTGVLRVAFNDETLCGLEGEVSVGTIYIDSNFFTEEGTPVPMSLTGKMAYNTMTLSGSAGTALGASDILCESGRTVLDSTTLNLGEFNATTLMELKNSRVELGDSLAKQTGELSGAIFVSEGDNVIDFILNDDAAVGKVNSVVDVAKGAKLTITGDRARFGSAAFAESGGTVVMEAGQVNLENSTGTHFGGTLVASRQGGAITLNSSGGSDNILREIDKLKVQAGTTLTLHEDSWNTIWNIHELTGEGNVTWNSQATHWYSSRVLLGAAANSEEGGTFKPDGDMGTYSGVFTVQRNISSTEENRVYASYVELAHDTILQGAKVNLRGCERGYVSLAVNTDNGTILGLDGNGKSVLYAGAAVEGGDKENNQLQYVPVSTRKANLVIKGGDESNFAGSVQAGADGVGLSLVMDGQGTQNFSGENVNLLNVTVNKGTLGFTHETALPHIAGQISIAQGAKLAIGDKTLTLGQGNVLAVQRAVGSSASASLGGSLLFSGGSLLFSGDAVASANGGALYLIGSARLDENATLTINFSEELSMQAGKTYTLSTGNWSVVDASSIQQGDLIYYDAQFATSGKALTVTLSNRADIQVWDGTEQQNTWSQAKFGQRDNGLSAEKMAVFNDEAQSTTVSIDGSVAAKQLLFDNNSRDYTLAAETSGNGVTADTLRQVGAAATTLGRGVTVTGEANIEAGTLVLESGSSVGSAAVAEGAVLKLAGVPALVPTSIAGDGSLVVDLDQETASVGGTDIAQILIQSGTLKVDGQPLGVKESLLVAKDGTLHATRADFLNEKSKGLPIQLEGTLKLDIGSKQDFTYTVLSPRDEEGVARKGNIIKTGSGAVTLKSSVSADTVTVSQGSLSMSDDIVVLDFLSGVDSVVVNSGASVTIGRSEYTVAGDAFGIGFAVDGKDSRLELSLAKSAVKTINGNVSVSNGATLRKFDGGLVLAGTTKLGNGSSDSVNLAATWGKSGWQFTGKVEGGGTVNLSSDRGDVKELYTFSNDANTFDGDFIVNAKTRLVAGSNSALAKADVDLKNDGGLLVATENAHIGNLTGTAGSLIELKNDKDRTSGTLTVNQTENKDFAGSISTNIALVKEGNGTLTLSGNNSHTGGTTVNDGTLVAGTATALGTGSITLTGGVLDLTAAVNTEALTMSGGKLVLGGESWISTTGDISLTGGELDLSRLTVIAGKNYTLASGANVTVDSAVTFILANEGLHDQFTLVSQDNSLVLFYGQPSPATDLIWDNKSGNGQWDIQGSLNWHAQGQPDGSSRFAASSNATFNGDSDNQTVTLAQDITAGTVTLEGSTHVTINGSHKLTAGRLTGVGTVTVAESATLTFNGGVSEEAPDAVDGTVNLAIATGGTVNVNGGQDNVLQDVTLQAGGALNFGAGSSTSIAGALELNGTLTNNGTLDITAATVASGATGVLAGSGQTTLNGSIDNQGTLVLDNANLKGAGDSAAITGNVVINGGTFSGNMALGSARSTITVTDVFTMEAGASYTVEGHMVLDALDAFIFYDGATHDKDNNGFIAVAFVTIYNTESEEGQLVLSEGATVSYKGVAGLIEGSSFMNEESDFTTFYVNTKSEQGAELYSNAKITAEDEGRGSDFKNLELAAGTAFDMDSEGAHLERVTAHGNENAASLFITKSATIDSVEVEAGILNILNAASVEVKDVTIGAGATLGVYLATDAPESPSTENEGTLTIKNAHSLIAKGAGATLNANVVMESGSTLDLGAAGGEGLTLGSSLTLQENVNLSDADFEAVAGLGYGESYILFNGVDSLTLGQTTYTEVITPEMQIDAADWFHSVEAKNYYVVYDGTNVGQVAIFCATPEPATSTLSLLALAALASRRRRKA